MEERRGEEREGQRGLVGGVIIQFLERAIISL